MNATLSECFREALRYRAAAISVITVDDGTRRTGFTTNALVPVSVAPPELLVTVNRASSSWSVLQASGCFGANLLDRGQQAVAERFSGKGGLRGESRYVGDEWVQATDGTWMARHAVARFSCEVVDIMLRSELALVVGRVTATWLRPEGQPLLYWRQAYGGLGSLPMAA